MQNVDLEATIPLNIGITGNSGTGKSTFINAIRDLTADDPGAAKVDVIEATVEPTQYAHPNNQLLKFWDLPGVGTPMFPKEGYLERIGFNDYDFFLIISKDRFTENDLWLANAITSRSKQFFFVRTHVHDNIKNDKKAQPRFHDKEAVLDKIRNEIRRNLGHLYRDEGIFLIDNYKRIQYDFVRLEQCIIEDFLSMKRRACQAAYHIRRISTSSEQNASNWCNLL